MITVTKSPKSLDQTWKTEWLLSTDWICFNRAKATSELIAGEFQEHRWTKWLTVLQLISPLKTKCSYTNQSCSATRCVQTGSFYSPVRILTVPFTLPSVLQAPHQNLHFCKAKLSLETFLLWGQNTGSTQHPGSVLLNVW